MKRQKELKRRKLKNQQKRIKEFLSGKLVSKFRTPHKPQQTHRDKSRYTRKAKYLKRLI